VSGDKYDEAIAYLTANPWAIRNAWLNGYGDGLYPGSCLFAAAGPRGPSTACSCLTIIRGNSDAIAATWQLSHTIRHDERLPKDSSEITVEHLPIFAEYQRRIDAMGVR
jgi:hypothetical protein